MIKNSPLRVLHVITSLNQGGAQAMLVNLLPGFRERFDVHVATLMDEGTHAQTVRELRVPLHCINMRKGRFSLAALLRLRTLISKVQSDVVQAWMYHGNLAVSMAAGFLPTKPVVAWNVRHSLYGLNHESLLTRQVIRLNRLLSRKSTTIYNSRLSRAQHEAFGFSAKHACVIPNGVDLERFAPSHEARHKVRAALGIADGSLVVGHVARYHPMKDHHGFLAACARLADKHTDVDFVLAGRDVTLGSRALAEKIPGRLRSRFHLLGARSDIPEVMSAMDLFCLSSAWGESWPNVVGEAMAVGLPCVTTDIGDAGALVGDTGVVVPPNSAEALAAGIERLITMPAGERVGLGQVARQRIVANHGLSGTVERYAQLYHTLAR